MQIAQVGETLVLCLKSYDPAAVQTTNDFQFAAFAADDVTWVNGSFANFLQVVASVETQVKPSQNTR